RPAPRGPCPFPELLTGTPSATPPAALLHSRWSRLHLPVPVRRAGGREPGGDGSAYPEWNRSGVHGRAPEQRSGAVKGRRCVFVIIAALAGASAPLAFQPAPASSQVSLVMAFVPSADAAPVLSRD